MDRLGPYLPGPNETPENGIYIGDCRKMAEFIPDDSLDLIFTDPPYSKEFLPLYDWLGEMAARKLKPGRFLLAMCGGLYLNEIFRMLDNWLNFFWKYEVGLSSWEGGLVWPRGNTAVNISTRAKPLMAYCKGKGLPRTSTLGLFFGSGNDKRYHIWGQDESSARYFIDCFSDVNELVLDPFCGGATTAAMCKVIHRRWLAFEIEPGEAENARKRVWATQPAFFPPVPKQLGLLTGEVANDDV